MALQKIRLRAPGAGKPVIDGATDTKRHNVMIDPVSLEVLEGIGDGNLSLGVREAARRLDEKGDIGKFSIQRHKARIK